MEPLALDFETASELSLPAVGAYVYAAHSTTMVLCAAFYIPGDDAPHVWSPTDPPPQRFLFHARQYGIRAWNASFERAIWERVCTPRHGWPALSEDLWHCTMADAHAVNLPGSLDAAARVLTQERKDTAGARLMRKMSELDGPRDAASMDRLYKYCAQDVRTELAVRRALPVMLPPERAVWLQDQRINLRGIRVDRTLVERCVALHAAFSADIAARALTEFDVSLTAIAQLRERLADFGICVPDAQAETLENARATQAAFDPENPGNRLLDFRLAAGAVSPKKFATLLRALGTDDRARGLLQYHGAGQTGRWAGRIVQPHNLPRPTLKAAPLAALLKRVRAGATHTEISQDYDVLDALNNLIRPCFIASHDALTIGDYSQIEARVLAWCAGDQQVLNVFRRGDDVYVDAYSRAFNVLTQHVTPEQRQIGKVMTLALGYAGGRGAFATMARAYGLRVTPERAAELTTAWRASHPLIVGWWRDLERAAIRATDRPGVSVTAGPVTYRHVGDVLWCRLPSGRNIAYPRAAVVALPPPWEAELPPEQQTPRPTLQFFGPRGAGVLRQYAHGGRLAENCVQAIARDVLADALLDAPEVVLHVHDEIICDGGAHEAALTRLMHRVPSWAPRLPIAAEVRRAARYGK